MTSRECNFTQCVTDVKAISAHGEAAKSNFSLSNSCVKLLDEAFTLVGHLNVYDVMGVCDHNDYCDTDYKPLQGGYAPGVRGGQSSSSYIDAYRSLHSTGSRVAGLDAVTGSPSDRFKELLHAARGRNLADTSDDTYYNATTDPGPAECLGSREPSAYMNRREVIIDTFKARDNGFCWGVCNRHPRWHYNATRPNLPRIFTLDSSGTCVS